MEPDAEPAEGLREGWVLIGLFCGFDVRETTRSPIDAPGGYSRHARIRIALSPLCALLRLTSEVWGIPSQGSFAAKRRKNRRAIAASMAPIGARSLLLPRSVKFTKLGRSTTRWGQRVPPGVRFVMGREYALGPESASYSECGSKSIEDARGGARG